MLVVALLTLGATQPSMAQTSGTSSEKALEEALAANPAPAFWRPQSTNDTERGFEIFAEADRRDSGYRDLQVDLRMILRTAKGRETARELRIKQLEVTADGDRVLAVFDAPPNIRGTALLSHGHIEADDDQWLYLPAVKRTKKIATRDKSGSFVGSEFSFEDLAPLEVAKYSYQYVGEEPCALQRCYVVDRFPLNKYSGYSKHRVWLDVEHLRILTVEFTDKRDRLEKRLEMGGYQAYEAHGDRFFKPNFMHMKNLLSGRSTDLEWTAYQFNNQLTADRDFSVNALRRAR